MLPILVIGATAGALVVARLLESIGLSDPDDPDGGRLPSKWGPGEAPGKPWRADKERPNGGVCWPNQHINAAFARWLNHEKGVPLPGDIQTYSRERLAAWCLTWVSTTAWGSSKGVAVAAEWDARNIECYGKDAWKALQDAPGKAFDFTKRAGKDIADWEPRDGVHVDAGGGSGTSIDVDEHGGSVTVGGQKLASW